MKWGKIICECALCRLSDLSLWSWLPIALGYQDFSSATSHLGCFFMFHKMSDSHQLTRAFAVFSPISCWWWTFVCKIERLFASVVWQEASSPSFTWSFVFLSADDAILRDPADPSSVDGNPANVNGERPEEKKKKLPYPKAVLLIIATEFCERFSFYGMRGGMSAGACILKHSWYFFMENLKLSVKFKKHISPQLFNWGEICLFNFNNFS